MSSLFGSYPSKPKKGKLDPAESICSSYPKHEKYKEFVYLHISLLVK